MPGLKITRLLLFILCFLLLTCQPETKSPPGSRINKLDSIFSTVPDFSGVVLIAENGKPTYHKAFGYKNFLTRQPMDTSAIFELASLSKQFTATIIMMLKEEGKLKYDDAIEKYISGLPYPGITIRHLLNHTSGLPDYQEVMDKYWDKTNIAGNDDNIEYLKKYKPARLFEPGEKYDYSNTGYMLLASVAEKTSGKDFITLCHEKIFGPADMRDTDIRTRQEKSELPSMAWGHIYVAEKNQYIAADSFPQFNYTIWLGNRKGPGRVSSTTTDLMKWHHALDTEKLLKRNTLEEAFVPARLNNDSLSSYGFGWVIEKDHPSGKVIWHNGDNPGYKTRLVRYIDADKIFLLLCNNAHPKYDELAKLIEAELFH
jgi:CubicO group peptidase (beta-lactamase class C family)